MAGIMSASGKIAFVNALIADPAAAKPVKGGVLVEDSVIAAIGAKVTAANAGGNAQVIDCKGSVLAPGLIDMRAFLGEPGASHRETLASASAAAAAGGVTTIISAPDTNPPVDGAAIVDYLRRRASEHARVRVLPCAALTKGLLGEEIAEIGMLREAGAVAFSNGVTSVRSSQVMRRALTYARDFDVLVMHSCEDADMARAGVMNEGEFAARLGLAGVPHEAESMVLQRDLALVALTGARYHASIVSNSLSVDLIRKAKAAGLPVTCATTINHLSLNENDIGEYRTYLKIAPPLRSEDERLALVAAVADGTIDAIVSDHNPQDVEAKRVPFAEAAYGAVGLETMLSAGLRLVHGGQMSLNRLIAAMSLAPARILRLPQGRLEKGAPADLVLLDPDEPFVVDAAALRSRSKNTPFDEARLDGRVKLTMVNGAVIHQSGL